MIKKIATSIASLLLASSLAISAQANSLHGPLTEAAYKEVFYGSQYPVSVVHIPWDGTQYAANDVPKQVNRFGKRLLASSTEHMHTQLERVRTVNGTAPAANQTLMVHRVATTPKRTETVCAVRGDAQWLESASQYPKGIDEQYASLRLLHEAFHCLLLEHDTLYPSLSSHLPGVSLYRHAEIPHQFPAHLQTQARLYFEHVHEVTADVGSVLLALVYMDLDETGLRALLDRRIRDRDYPHPVPDTHVGHHTVHYLRVMRHNATELVAWKENDLPDLLKRQPLQITMQLAYKMGAEQSYTLEAFRVAYQ
jgi:hypothetical protein